MAIKSEILDMCTDSDGNVWACGRNGLVMKYSNNKWIADTINIAYVKTYPDVENFFNSISYYNGKMFVEATVPDVNRHKNIYYVFTGSIDNWALLDSMIITSISSIRWGNWGLHRSDDGGLYSCGLSGVWKYENNQWLQTYYLDGEMYEMYSSSSNYIIAVSAFNQIFFYNGSSWQSISDIFKTNDPYFVFRYVTIVNKEIYVVGYCTINNKDAVIIWHGK